MNVLFWGLNNNNIDYHKYLVALGIIFIRWLGRKESIINFEKIIDEKIDTSICDFEECYEYRIYEYKSGTEYREARERTVPCYILPFLKETELIFEVRSRVTDRWIEFSTNETRLGFSLCQRLWLRFMKCEWTKRKINRGTDSDIIKTWKLGKLSVSKSASV